MTVTTATDERFRLLTEAAPIGMFEADAEGNCRYTNPEWTAITGVAGADALGRGWEQILLCEDADDVIARWNAAQLACATYHERFRIVSRGDVRWIEAKAVPTFVGSELQGWVGTFVDVTASVEAERANNSARDRAVEAARLKSEFVANISHEIRTPLNAVLGLSEILADTPLDEKQFSYVDTLRRAGGDLLTLLNDVLDLSKMEAGAMELSNAPFDLAEMVRNTAQLFATSARSKGLSFDVEVSGDGGSRIVGDAARLRQVVSNLIANAIKFTDMGGVAIRVSTATTVEQWTDVRIAVEDSGAGVSSEDRERIFDMFCQADSSPTRRARGSGLGLMICRQILDLMEGTLELESEPGVGSTFVVQLTLPIHDAVVDAPEVQTTRTRHTRALVVEDNAVNQLVLQTLLRQQGCEVDVAENGQIGSEFAAARDYDVVFMDCQMPVMDGYAATGAIRAVPGSRGAVPIVALTASAMPEDRQRCLDAGMDEYLPKPVSKAALQAVLDRVAREQR